jgi:hypothetical protein
MKKPRKKMHATSAVGPVIRANSQHRPGTSPGCIGLSGFLGSSGPLFAGWKLKEMTYSLVTFSSSSFFGRRILSEAALKQFDSYMFRKGEDLTAARDTTEKACPGFDVIWRMGGQKSHLESHQVHVMGLMIANWRQQVLRFVKSGGIQPPFFRTQLHTCIEAIMVTPAFVEDRQV